MPLFLLLGLGLAGLLLFSSSPTPTANHPGAAPTPPFPPLPPGPSPSLPQGPVPTSFPGPNVPVSNTPSLPPGCPPLDVGIPTATATAVCVALSTENRPDELRKFGASLRPEFPISAS